MEHTRSIPKDYDAEVSVLGASVLSRDALDIVTSQLNSSDFYYKNNRIVFDALVNLNSKSGEVDLVILANELKKMAQLEVIGGTSYLAEVVNSVPTAANVKVYVDILKEKSLKRQSVEIGSKLVEQCLDETIELSDALDHLEKNILSIAKQKNRSNMKSINSVLSNVYDQISNFEANQNIGISTGFKDVDALVNGFKNGDLVILAARPSVGKTTFALNIGVNAAKQGNGVLIYSLEMTSDQLGKRMLSSESFLESQELDQIYTKEKHQEKIVNSIEKLSNYPIFIEDTGSLSMLEMRSISRNMLLKHGIKLIIVDYLQLMCSGKKAETRFQEMSEIVRNLKALSKELNIPIIVLSQLSRAVEQRNDKRPQLSDLRETGEIEQTADVVMFLHRDDYYEKIVDDGLAKNVSEVDIIISKHRNGPTGQTKLIYKRDISKFRNMDLTNAH